MPSAPRQRPRWIRCGAPAPASAREHASGSLCRRTAALPAAVGYASCSLASSLSAVGTRRCLLPLRFVLTRLLSRWLAQAKVDFYKAPEQQTTPGPAAAPGLTPGTGLGDEQGLRSEIPSSVGSGRGTVSLPRTISHGGGANTGHLQNAIQSRQQAVLSASRAHTLSYSQSAVEKEEKNETLRLRTLMGKKSLHENSDTRGSPLTSNENLEIEGLIHQRKIRVAAEEVAKAQKSLGDQTTGAKTKSPASVVKTLSGACVIFEKTDDSMDEEVHRVSDNFLIPVNDPGTPGSLATDLLDIVSKEISIREEWTREHITAFMCSPTSIVTVIYRGLGGVFDQANVSGGDYSTQGCVPYLHLFDQE